MRALRRQKKIAVSPTPAYTDFPLFAKAERTDTLTRVRANSESGVVENENCIRQSVALLMSVTKGECFFAPNRGIVRDQQLFQIQDQISKRILEANLSQDIKNQEPRLRAVDVKARYVLEENHTELDVSLGHKQFGESSIGFTLESDGLFFERT